MGTLISFTLKSKYFWVLVLTAVICTSVYMWLDNKLDGAYFKGGADKETVIISAASKTAKKDKIDVEANNEAIDRADINELRAGLFGQPDDQSITSTDNGSTALPRRVGSDYSHPERQQYKQRPRDKAQQKQRKPKSVHEEMPEVGCTAQQLRDQNGDPVYIWGDDGYPERKQIKVCE